VSDQQPADRPVLKVISQNATPEEIAAIVAVVASLQAPAETPAPPRSLWARPVHRKPTHPGPGAWRASGLTR
jgi:hypothetical protein